MKDWIMSIFKWLNGLISPTGGDGQSGTKLMYLVAGLGSSLAATIMTLVAAIVGLFSVVAPFVVELVGSLFEVAVSCPHVALDGTFWSAYFVCLASLWVSIFGYATSAKKHAAGVTKDIEIAGMGTDK